MHVYQMILSNLKSPGFIAAVEVSGAAGVVLGAVMLTCFVQESRIQVDHLLCTSMTSLPWKVMQAHLINKGSSKLRFALFCALDESSFVEEFN